MGCGWITCHELENNERKNIYITATAGPPGLAVFTPPPISINHKAAAVYYVKEFAQKMFVI